jgi:hypothetical protein
MEGEKADCPPRSLRSRISATDEEKMTLLPQSTDSFVAVMVCGMGHTQCSATSLIRDILLPQWLHS